MCMNIVLRMCVGVCRYHSSLNDKSTNTSIVSTANKPNVHPWTAFFELQHMFRFCEWKNALSWSGGCDDHFFLANQNVIDKTRMWWPSLRKKALQATQILTWTWHHSAHTLSPTLPLCDSTFSGSSSHPTLSPFLFAGSITDLIWTWLGSRGLSRCASVYIHRLWVTADVCS